MYNVNVPMAKDKQKAVKVDQDLLRRLLVAADSGRDVNMGNILQLELSPVPLALAGTNHSLHSTNKADLVELLTESIVIKDTLPSSEMNTCLLIDGSAFIQAIGKPENAKTFGDLADTFTRNVFNRLCSEYSRVDVLFDRYLETSIKAGARTNRTGNVRPIRRVINSRNVKLPPSWKQFICLPAFLTRELIRRASELSPEN